MRGHPRLVADLLRDAAGAALPSFDAVTVTDANLDTLRPTSRQADLVIELRRHDRVALQIALEVQLRPDPRKWSAWLAYLAAMRPRGPACVLVLTPSRRVARWAAKPFAIGPGNEQLRVWVLGPDEIPAVVDAAEAWRNPELAMLSALSHGNRVPAVLPAAAQALSAVDTGLAELYCALLSNHLRAPVRRALEAHVMDLEKYRDLPRPRWLLRLKAKATAEGVAEGKAEGKAEGFAAAQVEVRKQILLRLAERAGLALTPSQLRRVDGCKTVKTLDRWIDRVASANSARELFTPMPRRSHA